MKKIKSITIIGKRWFDRINGNTYFNAIVLVNGKPVCKLPFQYGYGDQYMYEGFNWLDTNKYINRERFNNGSVEVPWIYCKENNIDLYYTAADVNRKKDLFK